MRLATIDVGTNTAILLVSEWRSGQLVVAHDEGRYVRLGEGVDASGHVSEPALHRLEHAFSEFADVARRHGADTIVVTGTSAARDATNPQALDRIARATLNVPFDILSGDEEAYVSFLGAVAGVRRLEADLEETHAERLIRRDVTHRATVIDVGGGSTEVVQGTVYNLNVDIEHSASMNVGSVRMTERHFGSLPPAAHDISSARRWLDGLLDGYLTDFMPTDVCIGSSGTPRILAHLHTGVENLALVDHGCPRIPADVLADWSDRLLSMTEDDVLALDPRRMRGRSDIFPAAALILRGVFERVGRGTLAVSSQGVRHGVAIRYFQENA